MIALVAALMMAQLNPLPTDMLTIGNGANSCRSWTLNKRRKSSERVADRQWLAGFLTGMEFSNTGLGAKTLLRDNDDIETLIGFVTTIAPSGLWTMSRKPHKAFGSNSSIGLNVECELIGSIEKQAAHQQWV